MKDKKTIGVIEDFSKYGFSKDDVLLLRKTYSDIKHKSERLSKPSNCLICGEEKTSFCKSHLIPRFILKRISKNGELLIGKSIANYPITNEDEGVGNALTFRCICDKCDNEKFQTYESQHSYNCPISEELLKEISIKNFLASFSRQIVEVEMRRDIRKIYNNTFDVYELDALFSINAIKKEMKGLSHYIIDDIELDYVTPIAFQGELALLTGFDGEIINEYPNKPSDYDPHILHIAVFPLDDRTRVLLFINDGDIKYRKFYRHFRKLSLQEKLYAINYIILLYKEDWALSPDYIKYVKEEATDDLIRKTQIIEGLSYVKTKEVTDVFKIKTSGKVHNFLMDSLD